MGWDKDSLTEQQREKKIATRILIKGYTKANDTECHFLTAHCPAVIPQPQPAPLRKSRA